MSQSDVVFFAVMMILLALIDAALLVMILGDRNKLDRLERKVDGK